MDQVRVLRIIEYTGPRDLIEAHLEKSWLSKDATSRFGGPNGDSCVIRGATLGLYPEILEAKSEVNKDPHD